MFSVLNDALPFNRIFTIGCYKGNPTVSKKIEQPGDLLSGGYGVDWCALIKTPRWEHREEKPGLFACPGGPARMKPFLTKFCGRTWKTIWCCAERFLLYPTKIFTGWWKICFAVWSSQGTRKLRQCFRKCMKRFTSTYFRSECTDLRIVRCCIMAKQPN